MLWGDGVGCRFRYDEVFGEVRFEKMTVPDVMFTVVLKHDDVFTRVLSKCDDSSSFCPAFGEWVLNEDGLSRVQDW